VLGTIAELPDARAPKGKAARETWWAGRLRAAEVDLAAAGPGHHHAEALRIGSRLGDAAHQAGITDVAEVLAARR